MCVCVECTLSDLMYSQDKINALGIPTPALDARVNI